MSKIEHIVFDVGHVPLNWDPELIYIDLVPHADERVDAPDVIGILKSQSDDGTGF